MVDMKKKTEIAIWEGCDTTVSEAIERFSDHWSPYSTASKRFPIARLIEEQIDQAVAVYAEGLPARYLGHIPGAGTGVSFSGIMTLVGLPAMARLQRQLLRTFVMTHDQQSENDRCFIATLETLIELVMACDRKKPASKDVRGLNGQRLKGFCRFCGATAELTSVTDEGHQRDSNDKLRLSNLYCTTHRPKTHDGSWNPAYRQAKRSVVQFDLELARLSRQCAMRAEPQAKSGDELVDAYIFRYMLSQTLHLADEAELRNLARLMVDMKLTDRRKQILVLKKLGFNQSDIARRLEIERQAVSKALRSVPDFFLFSPE
ncbi:LuxR family transcriptional regulator [Pseudomonas sp. WS 5503]|jgi:DNA-binding CsgD family transcriptional regulator|uniref:LuxR family transcriptional regulator n=1 Tax=Pseudomonas sp. WS 5503 TaxID=2717497 RepID=UPI0014729A61|nr:LuxR family transcriptional regulator [Pseudomonas sp. WS 5503]NMX80969.1 LuxR family transcriptional regulator [Pseudomonas sp. WS 5503]